MEDDLILDISIHALLAESDLFFIGLNLFRSISIHALLAESDRAEIHASTQQEKFLSTLSLRRATYIRDTALLSIQFLSTLSLRRATMI